MTATTTPTWATGSDTYRRYIEASQKCAAAFATDGVTPATITITGRGGKTRTREVLTIRGTVTATGTSSIPGHRTLTIDAGGRTLTVDLHIDPALSICDYPGGPIHNPVADAGAGDRIAVTAAATPFTDGTYEGRSTTLATLTR